MTDLKPQVWRGKDRTEHSERDEGQTDHGAASLPSALLSAPVSCTCQSWGDAQGASSCIPASGTI